MSLERELLLIALAVFGAVALLVGLVTDRVLSGATLERRRLRQ
jgi:hypothetical protein